MATLTVRNLNDELVKQLRITAAQHGRSAEAEHREILRTALIKGETKSVSGISGAEAMQRLAEFRHQIGDRGMASTVELLRETRTSRVEGLTGQGESH
jgi:plasmid stability protein